LIISGDHITPQPEEKQMATSSDEEGEVSKQNQQPSLKVTDLPQYIRLRTLLDSAEVGALRYYLNAPTGVEKTQHFDELKGMLQGIIDVTWPTLNEAEAKHHGDIDPCPPGYFDCGGCCVPYLCPE
jgi:hypothetical protein